MSDWETCGGPCTKPPDCPECGRCWEHCENRWVCNNPTKPKPADE